MSSKRTVRIFELRCSTNKLESDETTYEEEAEEFVQSFLCGDDVA